MPTRDRPSRERLDILDALRGSALLGILLLHAVEHWDFMLLPQGRPAWLEALDTQVVGWAYFLFGGKAYAIFALSFGISFFVTLDRWQGSADHPSARFLWRLALLGALGYLHGALAARTLRLRSAGMGLARGHAAQAACPPAACTPGGRTLNPARPANDDSTGTLHHTG